MGTPIYFPILYAKAGEIGAIGHLAPGTQDVTRPMLDFPRQKASDKRSLEQYFGKEIDEITRSWGTRHEVYLDFSRYPPDVALLDGRHVAAYVFEVARQLRLKAVPVVAPISLRGPGTRYFDAVSRVASRDGRGVAIRVPFWDFAATKDLERMLRETLSPVAIPPKDADVYLDAGPLALIPAAYSDEVMLAETMRTAALKVNSLGCRRVVCTASNFPDGMVHHAKGDVKRVRRVGFLAWRRLHREPSLGFLHYGDYGVVHPNQIESDGRSTPPSRVRATTPDEYVLYKGERREIRLISSTALEAGLLEGVVSWGANAVRECALGYGNTGGPKDWVERDTNMHIENTVASIIGTMPANRPLAPVGTGSEGRPWLQESFWLNDRR